MWRDAQTAQAVATQAIQDNTRLIQRWLRGSDQQLEITGTYGRPGTSLGAVFTSAGMNPTSAGNGFVMVLQRARGHRGGYYIHTLIPR
ncbi:RNase A-like domain-containing protein [Dactylosporangium sp. NPDC050588]|uniref:RNase A-like domain-containing protein n=1 Tax=Dactylosporangium sp. NPDC050588 TaxID=3157211 RepID=UPI0033DFD01A